MSSDVGHKHGSGFALLWLWHRLGATALIGPLAWEPPYAAGVAPIYSILPQKTLQIYDSLYRRGKSHTTSQSLSIAQDNMHEDAGSIPGLAQ